CGRPRGRARGGAAGVKRRWAEPLVGRLGAALVGLLAATWRYRVRGWEHVEDAHRLRRPIVYVLWHSRILPLLYSRRREGIALLIAVGARASSAWWLRSWDRFCLPKPFTTIEVAYSAPFTVSAGKDGLRRGIADAERALAEVTYGGEERGRGKGEG